MLTLTVAPLLGILSKSPLQSSWSQHLVTVAVLSTLTVAGLHELAEMHERTKLITTPSARSLGLVVSVATH